MQSALISDIGHHTSEATRLRFKALEAEQYRDLPGMVRYIRGLNDHAVHHEAIASALREQVQLVTLP